MFLVSQESHPVTMRSLVRALVVVGLALPAAARPQGGRTAPDERPADVRVLWEATVPGGPQAQAMPLGDVIIVYSPVSRVIRVHGRDGRLQREFDLATPPSFVLSSPRGDALLATRAVGEGGYEHEILDAEGRSRWSAALPYPLEFSPSGSFLLGSFDELASRQRPTAYRVATGEKAWSDEEASGRWYLAAAADDTLACYEHERLRLIDLGSGRLLWQREIKAGFIGGVGRLLRSRNGRVIAVQNVEKNGGEERRVTRVWDDAGALLWERAVKPVPGATNGGVLTAVSDGGAWLALDDLDHLSVLLAADGQETWRLEDRKTCCIRAFTDTLLVQQRGARVRLFALDRKGKLAGERWLDLPVAFLPGLRSGEVGLMAVVVQRAQESLRVSEVALRFGSPGQKP